MSTYEQGSVPRAGWFKSSYSNRNGSCVEVKFDGDTVLVRDTKYRLNLANDPAAEPIITLPSIKWKAFLEKVLDPSVGDIAETPIIQHDPAGSVTVRAADGTTLVYTEPEWISFILGIRDGEFELALV